ncbi:hypothetical protein BJ970_007122 [Saccharopolyspora phatthalungensis]|uniref:Uncharacterized protein n=1 Tax=Saccharopolyspora phatthalungensis TaxID=664693 RepID=A0A840QKV1_9PSEU|nr:hypothetical protein [Saccharopolyspora phatthalungensis]
MNHSVEEKIRAVVGAMVGIEVGVVDEVGRGV